MPKSKAAKPEPQEEEVLTVKGFNQDWTCRGFQFEIGNTYEHKGKVQACASGFHACEYPLDVLSYYVPATSRYALVRQSGQLARHDGDTKIASARITIDAEIKLPDLIDRAIKWVFDRAKPESGSQATGYGGAASATGDGGAASATGYGGAASATGVRGAASATGDNGAAMASGRWGSAMAAQGCALFLVYRDDNWNIVHAWAGIAGRDGIKPLVWYQLDEHGKPIEVQP